MKWPPKDILEILLLKYAADKINSARLARGMNKTKLAKRLGVTRPTVDRWELGRSRVSGSMEVALCDALELTPRDLVPDEKELRALRRTANSVIKALPDPGTTPHDKWAERVLQFSDLDTNEALAAIAREEERAAG